MTPHFEELTRDSAWRESVSLWVREHAQRHGITVRGDLLPFRVRPWSTHLTIESDEGRLWFKAVCEAMNHEPRLQTELAELVPDAVRAPLAIDEVSGWMLTSDHGEPLPKRREATAKDWLTVLLDVVDMQQRLMPYRERLLATGMPQCAPETVVDRFDRLSVLLSDLPDAHPSHLDLEDRTRLAEGRDDLAAAVDTLNAGPLGTSWQHADVHVDNVFLDHDRPRVFDFGDSQWAHVMETLVVPFSILSHEHPSWWKHIREVWSGAWGIQDQQFDTMWAAARRTQAVNRASTWHGLNDSVGSELEAEWSAMARHHLLRAVNV